MSLLEKTVYRAQTVPDRIALEDGQRKISYAALPDAITLYAEKLRSSGCQRLGIIGDNGADWILWDLAALHEDIPCVPLPPFFTQEQRDFTIATAGITHLAQGRDLTKTGMQSTAPLPPATAKITFTSGSTGAPKGVCLTRAGMETVAQSIGSALGPEYTGKHLCVLPLSILLENVAGVYTALSMGATACLPSLSALGMVNPFNPDFVALLKNINDTRATSIILVPELLRGLIGAMLTTGIKTPLLKFAAVGGARVAPELLRQAHALGLPVYEGYGLSECASVVSLNTPLQSKSGTAGKLLPHIQASIVNGEIVIDNPAFAGYLGEKPRVNIPYPTGDLGNIDAKGFITLQGRRKNVIVTGFGRNVSPEWVESYLLAQPAIAQAVVYGEAAPHLCALVVPAHPEADIQVAVNAANAHLPVYARVGEITSAPPFTAANGMLTGNGRVRRDFILRTLGKEGKGNEHDIL